MRLQILVSRIYGVAIATSLPIALATLFPAAAEAASFTGKGGLGNP